MIKRGKNGTTQPAKDTADDKAVPQSITCNQCGKFTPLVVKELPVGEDLWEGVIECQLCQYLYHTYFINTALRLHRKRLMKITQGGNISTYQARKAEYKRMYDAFQVSVPDELKRTVGEKAAVSTSNDNTADSN